MGNSARRIYAGMHTSNKFAVYFEDLNANELKFLDRKLRKMQFPNYFDEQRFSPRTLEIAENILQDKWKEAVEAALTKPSEFESEKSKEMKGIIAENWGKWKELSENLDLPFPKRKIFEELGSTGDFRKAFEMLPRKAIGIYCRSAQSLRFNERLALEIEKQKQKGQKYIEVAGRKLPVVFKYKALKRELEIDEIFPSSTVLKRKTYFVAKNVKIEPDKKEPSRRGAWIKFGLRKGCYATMLVKFIKAISGSSGK